jgi:hypothetical protein
VVLNCKIKYNDNYISYHNYSVIHSSDKILTNTQSSLHITVEQTC